MQPHEFIEAIIRKLYFRLTEDELKARTERRDEFFIAVRKKHGIARAQAEMFLHDLEAQFESAAA